MDTSVLNKVTQLSGILKNLLPIKEEYQQRLDKKFRLEFNFNSNHLEGNTLTYGETLLLLIFDETQGNHTLREYEEVKAHDVAYALIKEWASDKEHPLTESYIKNLNKVILVRPFWKDALTPDGQTTRRQIKIGDYKEYPNSVRLPNGEIFHYASPSETPIQMGELMNWYRQQEKEGTLHPIELAALFHYKFVCIHPFDDGNGRISRLLMNYVLLRNNLPPAIIKSADKKNYLQALHLADAGDIQAFINYIAQQLVWSLEISIKAANSEDIDEPGDLDKRLFLIEKELESVDSENEVKKRLNKEVFLEIYYDSWLSKLIEKNIIIVQKFNRFFTGINHSISAVGGAYVSFENENPASILEKFSNELKRNEDRLNNSEIKVSFQAQYGTFKKGGLNTFGCNYGFEVIFSTIKYELYVDKFVDQGQNRSSTKLFEKLLHQPLNESEIDLVANSLSEAILTHIDVNTKKIRLR